LGCREDSQQLICLSEKALQTALADQTRRDQKFEPGNGLIRFLYYNAHFGRELGF
jgi:hypothetical protein